MHNRDTRYARQYHEATKHSPASVYGSRHVLDWENQPLPYKLYPDLAPLPLPQALPASGVPALQALSTPVDSQRPAPLPTLHDLAYVLFYSAGVTRRRHIPGYGEVCFRAAACTGALYHIELYLAVADLPALPAGVYHFNPIDFALRCLRQGDFRRLLFEASGCHPRLAAGPGGDSGYRHLLAQRLEVSRARLPPQLLGRRNHLGQLAGSGHRPAAAGAAAAWLCRCHGQRPARP
ncbi:MAG: hypothetical protein KatS3mg131_4015 [Candidatus Tectimicrobiota bacterium]|nr:MAG: hypothetical protein KatS3mg131_4015 [Candidatus Tectomicrobia bacterium]